jgi:hypothetical protein
MQKRTPMLDIIGAITCGMLIAAPILFEIIKWN